MGVNYYLVISPEYGLCEIGWAQQDIYTFYAEAKGKSQSDQQEAVTIAVKRALSFN